ncbi:DAHP synthetase [Cantharellus anzutake]|uniref:DAHP synthetase n=1 Tax=Cantharellus anzutake TaxID=1750568 RepID=UPI0019054B4E|nr:DAHP synthetase [Cantharellus anzutake]KAF8339911.1 DAHP synthetase [Cantharellus anzutake]
MLSEWTPWSWRERKVAQDVNYPDKEHLERVLKKLKTLPPLITPSEIERLRHQLVGVQENKDCAESFEACTQENIEAKIGLILSFSLILIWGARLPIVRIGRIAGQYAKPRSSSTETVDGKEILSFRGDNVNEISPDHRTPDPDRLLSAYFHSTTTLNYIRSLLASGFASLNHPSDWSLSHVRSPALRAEFERISEGLADALDFSKTIGAEAESSFESGGRRGVLGEVDFYTSHEGLMLNYEEALTRELPVPVPGDSLPSPSSSPRARLLSANPCQSPSYTPNHLNGVDMSGEDKPVLRAWYNTSAHFIWVGDRTRQLDGAHIEYFRGIRNPIGIKVGPSMGSEELIQLLDIVNPDRENGKVTLITRYGASKVEQYLPAHIAAVRQVGHPVIWVSDPMHGNTQVSSTGHKTRHFANIVRELTACLSIHAANCSRLGGVSLEFTGEMNEERFSVTECLGGSMELAEDDLGLRYETFCDPRLNFEQSLDLAFLISDHFKKQRGRKQSAKTDDEGHSRSSANIYTPGAFAELAKSQK